MNRTRNDKRTLLIEAAAALFYRKGIHTTTLADIATLANVPLGNVYYYFQSKDSIILAVIELHRKSLQNLFLECEHIPDAKDRLIFFVQKQSQNRDEIVCSGDKIGSLCQELGKQTGPITEAAIQLMEFWLAWCAKQFGLAGQVEPLQKALTLLCQLQGTHLMALAFKNSKLIEKQEADLLHFIDQVSA